MKRPASLRIALLGALLVLNHCAPASPITLGVRNDTIAEVGSVTYTIASTGRNELAFLPPARWKSSADAKDGIVTWTSPDYRSMIRIKIEDDNGDAVPKLQPEELRERAVRELSDAKITEQSPCYASGSAGIAFDSQRLIEEKFPVTCRIAFIPVAGGFVQLNLTAPKDQFAKKQIELSHLLNSLRITKSKPN